MVLELQIVFKFNRKILEDREDKVAEIVVDSSPNSVSVRNVIKRPGVTDKKIAVNTSNQLSKSDLDDWESNVESVSAAVDISLGGLEDIIVIGDKDF